MARSDGSSGEASQLPKSEAATSGIKVSRKLTRRQLTLISLTVCLNLLLWSSVFVLIVSLYLIASDPNDTTNIPAEVLTITSSLASVGYIITHTIFSLKQRIWRHQRRHPSTIKKNSYVAVRIAVTLCVLWLLTSGWNMITVARSPVCLPEGPGVAGWESGATCVVGRASIAISFLALIASCTLFGMLAVLRRPFEAHVFKHGHQDSLNPSPTPSVSRRPSPTRSISHGSDKYRGGRISASTHRSTTTTSNSNTDVDTLDLNLTSPPTTIHAPSPIRSIGLGIFTSRDQPPPLPAAYIPPRSTSAETPPPFVQPTTSYHQLPPPPRMSALVAPSGFVPLSIPPQFSASAWRAVHPPLPSPLGPAASRSNPHLPHTSTGHNFTYRTRYSRSSVSLTRPHRLSSATPAASVAWSSRSGSTGPGDEGRGSPASGSGAGGHSRRPSANSLAYAILNGTPIPGTEDAPPKPINKTLGHMRHSSAPDTSTGAVDETSERMAKGWKPNLQSQAQDPGSGKGVTNGRQIVRSSSAELLSKFSPDSSPGDTLNLRSELVRELDGRLGTGKGVGRAVRKARSESPLRHSDVPGGGIVDLKVRELKSARPVGKSPSKGGDGDTKSGARERRMTFDEVKNKPLPKIASL